MILNTYFIHNTIMKEREITFHNFRASMAKHTFDDSIKVGKVSTIESFDPKDIDGSTIQKTVNYAQFEEGSPFVKFNGLIKNLHIFHLSNALKHFKALEVIAESDDNTISLVLEDDVSFDPKTMFQQLEKAIKMYQTGSIMFLGLPNNTPDVKELQVIPSQQLFEILPYNDSYLIDKITAKKILSAFLPIKFVANLQFSIAIRKAEVNCTQTVPNIFVDGSKLGLFTSSMNANNILVFNPDYMRLRDIVSKEEIKATDKSVAEQLIANSPCGAHPDFQYLKALYYNKIGESKTAQQAFEGAYQVYSKNLCILNHESQFLKDFMRLYKDLQIA